MPCVLYVLARGLGKGLGAFTGAILARCSARITRSIPYGFMPQAGVALGLAVIFEGDARIPAEVSSFVVTMLLAAVTINEIIGPFFTRMALSRAKEAGLDRPRLVEFLDEEFILTGLEAKDKGDVLRKLTDFYARTRKISAEERKAIYESVVKREEEGSTGIGRGAALPHGHVENGSAIRGILGICPEGVEFDAPDGEPVKLFVLIVTPKEHEQRHVEVLASLNAMLAHPVARTRLIAATNANEAWEVLESEETRDYNYFLEVDGEPVEE
ncbi:MAG: PTS sugar transporter subunit IIA [Candidatus Hydrogenedentes bacterium]|nr:PTS sugar transporter subunit IIA [Candidatus Hydrogenedentota bacterium]